jgi:Tripartite tricarboxylate transporter TctB family
VSPGSRSHGDGAAAWLELLIWLGVAGLAFALTFQFASEAGTYAWGAASWPRAIIVLMALIALLQYAGRRPRPLREPQAPTPSSGISRSAAALLLPLAYVFLLPRTGFHLTTLVFVLIYLLLLGERRPAALVGVPLGILAAVVLVFTKLFYVALPTGNWPGFYELSNAFVELIR